MPRPAGTQIQRLRLLGLVRHSRLPGDDTLAEPTEGLRRAIAQKAQRADTRLMTRFQQRDGRLTRRLAAHQRTGATLPRA